MLVFRSAAQCIQLSRNHQTRTRFSVGFGRQLAGVLVGMVFNNLFYDISPLPFLIRKHHVVTYVCPKHSLGKRVHFRNKPSGRVVLVCSDLNRKLTFGISCQTVKTCVPHFNLRFIVLCLDDRDTKSFKCELRSGRGRCGGGNNNTGGGASTKKAGWRARGGQA